MQMSLYFCLKLNKKFSLDQESLTAVRSYFIHYVIIGTDYLQVKLLLPEAFEFPAFDWP